MPDKEQHVKQVINTIHSDPDLLNQLLAAGDEKKRHDILEQRGVIQAGEHGPKREEVEKEIKSLMSSATAAPEERVVEWVTAVATAAAGAAAAFCAAE